MSWHFLQGQEVASWPESSLDGAPSALLKLIPTQDECFWPGSEMESLNHSQCGTMSAHSMESSGEGTLMSSPQDSRVRTSVQQEKALELRTVSGLDSGGKQLELLARYCRHSRSWKIARCLPIEGLALSCKIWPKWGTMRNGVCSRLKSVDYRTKGPGCSLLPTPLKSDGLTMSRFKASSAYKAVMGGHQNKFCYTFLTNSVPLSTAISITEAMMGWPKQWTALDAVETDGFHKWLSEHGKN